jgi:hypothetical protein
VTCIRLDATVTFAQLDKELAEANFKGYGHHPLIGVCDNTGGEPLAWMLRYRVLDAAAPQTGPAAAQRQRETVKSGTVQRFSRRPGQPSLGVNHQG